MKPLAIGWLWVLVAAAPSVWAFSPPAPEHVPDSITVRGKTLPLRTLQNPFRQEGVPSPAPVQEGARLYMENCLLCHGDLLDGRGLFADRFFPPPANFHSPASLRGRPEYYGFWRIMKGGPGLPDQYEPWNSAMPAWENTLTEEQVWKVLLFIYDRIWHPGSQPPSPQPSAARGAEVYQEKCVHCHGPKGKGDGTAAAYSSPRPRNLTKGHYKFRSTPFGKIPTDQDLHDMLTRGMPGTTMPSWKHLPETDLLSLVAYLKVLGKKKFDRAKRKKKIPQAVPVPEPPPFTLESKERGRALFIQNCSGCHGVRGRGDGDATKKIVDIASDAIRPRNLTKPWTFRRGFSRKDLFLTLRTGLSTTAMPRFSPRIHNDGNLWNIVNYVETLSPGQKPDIERKLHAIQVSGRLPEVPEDPAWGEIPTYFIPLGGQIMQGKEKAYFPTVDNVWVQAMHNGKEIALRVRWDDPTFDPILKKSATVEESPPPPLPLEFQVDASELDP
ncbi:MAG: c-type cytochrome, partial [Nitrospinaceae bacterium]